MQVARLLEPREHRNLGAKLRQIVRAFELEHALSKDGDSVALSDARALWRQSRRHPCGVARLFRQGATSSCRWPKRRFWSRCRSRPNCAGRIGIREAARAARDRVLDRVAAAGVVPRDEIARAKSARRAARAQAVAGAGAACADQVVAAEPDRRIHRLTIDADLQKTLRGACARARARARPADFGRHPRGRQCNRRGARARRLRRLFRRAPRRPGRHDAGAALARLDARSRSSTVSPSRTACCIRRR